MANSNIKSNPNKFLELRCLAEEALGRKPKSGLLLNNQKADQIFHELQVYQIELEMQNEELRKTQDKLLESHAELQESKAKLQESQEKYQNSYDFAPVGYLSISFKGIILQANQSIATMLGVECNDLVRTQFADFVCRKTKTLFTFIKNESWIPVNYSGLKSDY